MFFDLYRRPNEETEDMNGAGGILSATVLIAILAAALFLAGCAGSQAATKLPPRYESRSELVVKGPRYDPSTGDLDLGGIGVRSTCHGDCPKYPSYPYNYYGYGGYGYGANRGVYPYGIAPYVCPTCQ